MTEVGAAVYGVDQGGCGCPDLKENLRGSGSDSNTIRVGDMSDGTAYWEVLETIPPQGGPQAVEKTTQERKGRRMEYPPMAETMEDTGLQEV